MVKKRLKTILILIIIILSLILIIIINCFICIYYSNSNNLFEFTVLKFKIEDYNPQFNQWKTITIKFYTEL